VDRRVLADPDVHTVGASYFRIVGPTYPFVAVSMVLAFAFQGLGRAIVPLVWMVFRVVAVLIVSIVCTQPSGSARAPSSRQWPSRTWRRRSSWCRSFFRIEGQLARRMGEPAGGAGVRVGRLTVAPAPA
jgi:hypothetical protein